MIWVVAWETHHLKPDIPPPPVPFKWTHTCQFHPSKESVSTVCAVYFTSPTKMWEPMCERGRQNTDRIGLPWARPTKWSYVKGGADEIA